MESCQDTNDASELIGFFLNSEAAFAFLQKRRWSISRRCPRCGAEERFGEIRKETGALGHYKCYACRKFFTLRTGTSLEGSHLPFSIWVGATYLMVATGGRIGLNTLACLLGITIQTATRLKRLLQPNWHTWGGETDADDTDNPDSLRLAAALAAIRPDRAGTSPCLSPRQLRHEKLSAFLAAVGSEDVNRAFEAAIDRLIAPVREMLPEAKDPIGKT